MSLIMLWLPLISFIVCGATGRLLGQRGSCIVSCLLLGLSFLLSWKIALLNLITNQEWTLLLWEWVPIVTFQIEVNLVLDKLSSLMLTIVFTVSFLVHLYSSSYMWGDPHLPRFMSYLSLFTFFMSLLVQAGNLPLLFIGWEGVGLCSYLLVNFWFSRILANTSAIKAMLVNRVGDLALILAMGLLWFYSGGLDWVTVNQFDLSNSIVYLIICLLILIGAAGKSAQLGLHTWLPDAMEGPTPVSALIHAATMVTAGVFLILRCAPLFESSSTSLLVVALLGSITAFFAASAGLSQSDIKKVIAYSTTSQLGYMVASCGLCYFSMGFNHLINHAYFKALLFLSAGAIIHNNINEQDLRKIGSQWEISPISLICIIIGSVSLMGFPFMTGFYSKDLIIELSTASRVSSGIFILLLGAAGLTAGYSIKLINITFLTHPLMGRKNITKNDSNDWLLLIPLIILSIGSIIIGFINQFWVNFPTVHPLIESLIKALPLLLSIISTALVITFYFKIRQEKLIKINAFREINSFLFNAWQFNLIINYFISNWLWNISHHHNYKIIDKGWIEGIIPKGHMRGGIKMTMSVSLVQSGSLLNYITITILFFTLIASLTY